MTPEEREAFLADVHVGVLAVDEPGRGPLAVPIWYLYRDGEVGFYTDGASVKAQLLAAAGRATLTVQTETWPYQFVSVEGPVVLVESRPDELEMAVRYLGPERGRRYAEDRADPEGFVVGRLTPEQWRTKDYRKIYSGGTDAS